MKRIIDRIITLREAEAPTFGHADETYWELLRARNSDQADQLEEQETRARMMAASHVLYTPQLRERRFRFLIDRTVEQVIDFIDEDDIFDEDDGEPEGEIFTPQGWWDGVTEEELLVNELHMQLVADFVDAALIERLFTDGYLLCTLETPSHMRIVSTEAMHAMAALKINGRIRIPADILRFVRSGVRLSPKGGFVNL